MSKTTNIYNNIYIEGKTGWRFDKESKEANKPFVIVDGEVFINKAFVSDVTVDYPVVTASDNYSWSLFKDGNFEIRDNNGTIRVAMGRNL